MSDRDKQVGALRELESALQESIIDALELADRVFLFSLLHEVLEQQRAIGEPQGNRNRIGGCHGTAASAESIFPASGFANGHTGQN